MIDPWEAAIQFLLYRSELASLNKQIGRTWNKSWTPGSGALVFVMDSGSPDEAPVHLMRFESRCLSTDVEGAMDTWLALKTISRDANREPVLTAAGTCVIYSFLPASGPSKLYDQDLGLHEVTGFWGLNISEVTA